MNNSFIQKLKNLLGVKKQVFTTVSIIITISAILFLTLSFKQKKPLAVNLIIDNHFEVLLKYIDSLETSVTKDKTITEKQYYFSESRKNYKYIEAVIEYAAPSFAKYYINGPPINKHNLEYGNKIIEPHGFQLLESVFYSNDSSLSKEIMLEEILLLKENIIKAKKKYESINPENEEYFTMVQMELVRLITLNISGYDCSITKENIVESTYILTGLNELLESIYFENGKHESFLEIQKLILNAKSFLLANSSYDSFDRLHFIVNYIKPMYYLIAKTREDLDLYKKRTYYAINFKEKNLFGNNFFNKQKFLVAFSDTENVLARIELGKNLFFDPILSANNQRACASCHKPELGFSDSISTNFEYNKVGFLKRNTPTLLNVMYQKNFFYDGRSFNLEAQANDVLHAKLEMNAVPEDVIFKLNESQDYKNLFKKAFKGHADTAITFYAVLKSIAEYERSLVSMNSRFDKYLSGDNKALTASEINGYTLFSGKALCGSCHFLPLFNGLVPPLYKDNEFEVIGTLKGPNSKEIDPDSGRVTITKKDIHLYSFKTPTLRNIENTAPYMHNGNYKTLDQIIEFYNKGGSSVIENKISNQTLPFDSLQLTAKEKIDIKSFLLSLSDNPYKNSIPKKLPTFKDARLNKRKIGGEY